MRFYQTGDFFIKFCKKLWLIAVLRFTIKSIASITLLYDTIFMAYPTKAVANKFIEIAKKNGLSITAMKLQKLVYFAHGWYLALTNGQPLIDEKIEAWRYGPVVPSLYHEFKSHGSGPIERYAIDIETDQGFRIVTPRLPEDGSLSAFIDKVWEVYGNFTAIQLSNMTHESETPWDEIWGSNGVPKNTDIDDAVIKKYFDKKVREDQSGN